MKFFLFFLLLILPFAYTQSHKPNETCEHCKENCNCTGGTCTCDKGKCTCEHCKKGDGHKSGEACEHCKKGDGHKSGETCEHCKENCNCTGGTCTCDKGKCTCEHCKKGDGHKSGEACEHCKKGDGHKSGETCEHCKKGDGHKTNGDEPKESATATPQNTLEADLRSELRTVLTAYLAVKDALAKDNPSDAVTQAKALRSALGKVTRDKLQTHQRAAYAPLAAKIDQNAASISGVNALKDQRTAFIPLSEATIALVKTFNILETPIYQQFCPMANQGKGADWLSTEKAIKNPYYGKSMLTCGNVKATIN